MKPDILPTDELLVCPHDKLEHWLCMRGQAQAVKVGDDEEPFDVDWIAMCSACFALPDGEVQFERTRVVAEGSA